MPNSQRLSKTQQQGLKKLKLREKAIQATKVLAERIAARNDFLSFVQATMPDYQAGWHHRLMAEKLQQMATGTLRRLIISLPPRHGKSELASRRFPAWALGRNPNTKIIATSYGADLASSMNRDVQRIMDSSIYQQIFPKVRLNESNVRTESGIPLRNSSIFEIVGHSGAYRSAGVGGGITGLGGNILICDDPIKSRAEADSPVFRQKVWDWYTSTFYTRQEQDARILIIMTRWHTDDLAGMLIQKAAEDPSADQWEVVRLPAIAGHDLEPYDHRSPGEALWPEKYTIEKLNQMKASIDDYEWAALYDQSPRSSGGVEWPPEYFPNSIWFDEWPNVPMVLKVIGVDPSKGASASSGDYSAIVKMGMDAQGNIWCEAIMERLPAESLIDLVIETQDQFRADAIAFETNQFQELLAVGVRQKALQAGFPVPVVSVINNIAKTVRIRRLGPYLRQGQFRFKAKSKGTTIMIKQMQSFPNDAHDDGPDALEMGLRSMIEMYNGRKNSTARGLRA